MVLGPLVIRGEDRRSLLAFGRRRILHSEHLLGAVGLRARRCAVSLSEPADGINQLLGFVGMTEPQMCGSLTGIVHDPCEGLARHPAGGRAHRSLGCASNDGPRRRPQRCKRVVVEGDGADRLLAGRPGRRRQGLRLQIQRLLHLLCNPLRPPAGALKSLTSGLAGWPSACCLVY